MENLLLNNVSADFFCRGRQNEQTGVMNLAMVLRRIPCLMQLGFEHAALGLQVWL